MKRQKIIEIATAAVCLMAGIIALTWVIPTAVQIPSTVKQVALSPDFWPRIIVVIAILASAALLMEALIIKQKHLPDPSEDAELEIDEWRGLCRVALLIAALFAFYFSLPTMGIVAASIVLILVMMLFFGERKSLILVCVSFGLPVLLYLFFYHVASVALPVGFLTFLR